jgi:hypothetical protein
MNASKVSEVQLYPLTSALIAGRWLMSCSSCFTSHKDPVHTVQDNGRAPQQVWKGVGVYENISEHPLEAYISKVFARIQHRCHEPISCKILDSKPSKYFPNSDMLWGSAEQIHKQLCSQQHSKPLISAKVPLFFV